VTPARPGPGSDALRETLAYYRDLGVAELYLIPGAVRALDSPEEHEDFSANANRAGKNAAASSAAARQAEPPSLFTFEENAPYPGASKAARIGQPSPGASSIFEERLPYPAASPAARRASALELKSLAKTVSSCVTCRLCKTRKQTVFSDGSPEARIMFIGEAPGADEDAQGVPFVGRAGQLLTRMIEDGMGLPRSSVYIANVLKCRPPDNRNPEPDEIASCRGYLERQIDLVKPEVIVALGKFAAQCLLRTTDPITRIRGREFKYRDAILIPTYHPAYLLRTPSAKREVWEDMKRVRAILSTC
jgi:uracil-DNA glycosylase